MQRRVMEPRSGVGMQLSGIPQSVGGIPAMREHVEPLTFQHIEERSARTLFLGGEGEEPGAWAQLERARAS
jgi:hypothetical protein